MGNQIRDAVGNEYGKPKDVVGENRYAFTSHADAAFDVCFENVQTSRTSCLQESSTLCTEC
jgi:p24 family protein delta-1